MKISDLFEKVEFLKFYLFSGKKYYNLFQKI
jgi:hypothetical protein